jgi:hypothetical protein
MNKCLLLHKIHENLILISLRNHKISLSELKVTKMQLEGKKSEMRTLALNSLFFTPFQLRVDVSHRDTGGMFDSILFDNSKRS